MQDKDTTGKIFQDSDIDIFRDRGLRYLYQKKLAKEDSNYSGTYTDMPLADLTTIDFALPTNWQRVTDISFWFNSTTTYPVYRSGSWDDRARAGYVRIFDAPNWSGYRINLLGLKNWTGIDDSAMPDAVYNVVLTAAQVYAVQAYANKRSAQRRNLSAAEVTLSSEGVWYSRLVAQLRQDVKEARKAFRPIGNNF